jgi:FkbM family methyltransferase
VQFGTPELYEVFPNSTTILVEPVREFEPALNEISNQMRDARIVWAAASNRSGRAQLTVADGLSHSTLRGADGERWENDLAREVDLVTLDEICERENTEGPYLIKVDVDGTDLDVLDGATQILANTDCVIIESHITQVVERTGFLEDRGLFLWGLVDLGYKQDALFQFDLVFLSKRFQSDQDFVPWLDPYVLGTLPLDQLR